MIFTFLLLLACGASAGQCKQNFRAKSIGTNFTDLQALQTCFQLGYCSLSSGCCNGNGLCVAANNASASCQCTAPQECRSGLSPSSYGNYSGTYCNVPPAGCCSSGSDDLSFSHMGDCHLNTNNATTMDPEVGARGNLLVRTGSANYADGYSTSLFPNNSFINSFVSNLTSASRGVAFTSGNMMGLGFLEFAIKDIVDYEYNYNASTPPLGPNNVTYPALQWQTNTGIGAGIPKEFANNASAVIDLGPLFDWAHRVLYPGSSNITGPYLDLTDALTHWNNTHHMSEEFLVALRYYHAYHNFVARNLEEFFCGQNSLVAAISNTCTVRANYPTQWPTSQSWQDWVYEQARRSTIRFSQALLQTSVLQLALEYYDSSVSRSGMDGYFHPSFQIWWRRDETQISFVGDYFAPGQYGQVNQHSNWNGDITRTGLGHHIQAGLDYLISMRNPNTNTAASNLLNTTCSGFNFGPNVGNDLLAQKIVQLSHTSLQRYGSQVQSVYASDLALQFYRMGELGLGSYNTHVSGLTNSPSAAPSDTNLYFGSQIEWDSGRQYHNTIASVVMASLVEISDVTSPNVDRTGYYHYDTNTLVANGNLFHPDPNFITVPSPDSGNCYIVSGACSTVAANAGLVILGSTNINYYGVTYGSPLVSYVFPGSEDPVYGDYSARQSVEWEIVGDFANPLFYQYDGTNSLALKQADSPSYNLYLPNQFMDSIPTNVAWNNVNFDGTCYNIANFFPTLAATGTTDCRTYGDIFYGGGACLWNWPSL